MGSIQAIKAEWLAGWVDVLAQRATQATPDFDREKWLAARGLEMSPLRSLGAGAAVIAPAVAGLLAAVFKHRAADLR